MVTESGMAAEQGTMPARWETYEMLRASPSSPRLKECFPFSLKNRGDGLQFSSGALDGWDLPCCPLLFRWDSRKAQCSPERPRLSKTMAQSHIGLLQHWLCLHPVQEVGFEESHKNIVFSPLVIATALASLCCWEQRARSCEGF